MAGGFFDGLLQSIENPLFLGGVGLMSGGGDGLQKGLLAGNQMLEQRKKQAQQQALQQGIMGLNGISDQQKQILANSPELATHFLAQQFDPMADLKRRTAEEQLKLMPLEYKAKLSQIDTNNLQAQQLRQKINQEKALNDMFMGLGQTAPQPQATAPPVGVPAEGPGRFAAPALTQPAAAPPQSQQNGLQAAYAKLSPEKQTAFKLAWQSGQKDDAINILKSATDGLGPYKGAKELADVEEGLRKEYSQHAKPYFDVRDAYARVNQSAKDPSAAGDLALIFNYMKMLDPGSVVREGEFATAQNAAGIPDRIRNMWNKALNGERLNDNQRSDFVNQSHGLMSRQEKQYQKVQEQYRGIATRIGARPDNVFIDYSAPPADGQNKPDKPPPGVSRPKSALEYQSLPPGTAYIDPDGNTRVKQ